MLQVGVNLDHGEIFVENGKKYKKGVEDLTPVPVPQPPPASTMNQVDSGFASGDTYAIFKNNDARRDYGFGEMLSGLGGKDVGVNQLPYSILPQEDAGFFDACLALPSPAGVKNRECRH